MSWDKSQPLWILHRFFWIIKKWKKHYESKKQWCFKYSVADTINHENIGKHPERISNIRPFIDQYDWKEIDFPIWSKDWKRFETNNKAIVVMFLPSNSDGLEKIRHLKTVQSVKTK